MKIEDIFKLIEKVDRSSLSEVKIKEDNYEITLKKGGAYSGESVIHQVKPQHSHVAGAMGAPVSQSDANPLEENKSGLDIIKSPLVGTFYRSPSPDSPAFSEPGKKIKTGDTLCILEAMKVMNELTAEYDFEIVNILVENGTLVEYGTPLFEVKR